MNSKKISFISFICLIVIFSFVWGWLSVTKEVFPGKQINALKKEIKKFTSGEEGDKNLSVAAKIKNDLNLEPTRQLVPSSFYNNTFTGCQNLQTQFIKKS
ncbi:MAG: hypothetical protein QNL04_13985, partial [SAR324 cluster bacterium]|nr:hypothetical protein [SAR324 cluster bacterium]